MLDDVAQPSGVPDQTKPPAYRVIILNADGTVFFTGPLPTEAENDGQAGAIARGMMEGRDVELWDGLRFIEHYKART